MLSILCVPLSLEVAIFPSTFRHFSTSENQPATCVKRNGNLEKGTWKDGRGDWHHIFQQCRVLKEQRERERERRWVKDIIIEREETEHMISSEYSIILLIDEKSAQRARVRILFTNHVEQVSEPFGEQRKLDSKGYEHNHKANIEDKKPLSLCE